MLCTNNYSETCSINTERNGVIAIIPARGGSKGIPCKNIKPVCQIPLIAYSILLALRTRNIDRVFVSTEDPDIAAVAVAYGAHVPFLRSPSIATDKASPGKAIAETLTRLKMLDVTPEAYVVFFPTHPFRSVKTVEFLVDKLLHGHTTVNALQPIPKKKYAFFAKNKTGKLTKLFDNGFDPENFNYTRTSGYFIGSRLDLCSSFSNSYVHYLNDPVQAIDIDTPYDLALAEEIIKNDLYDINNDYNPTPYYKR